MPSAHCAAGVGPIPLPLQARDASLLIAQARQAPFGKGEQTLVDTNVRNTWQLEPGQFSLDNPRWPGLVQELVQRVRQELGVQQQVG